MKKVLTVSLSLIASLVVAKPQLMDITGMERAENMIVYENCSFLYLVTLDGKHYADLHCEGESPIFSPDGRKIAFELRTGKTNEIYIINCDGTSKIQLTDNKNVIGKPVWSPDGQKIAFTTYRDMNRDIYIMNADGSDQKRLTNNDTLKGGVVWSPDSRKLAFASEGDIYLMNADGSEQMRLIENDKQNHDPVWSPHNPIWFPDGLKIAFDSYSCYPEIYIVNIDGSGLMPYIKNDIGDFDPDFSPDGSKVVYISYIYSDSEDPIRIYSLYSANADGSGETKLIRNRRALFISGHIWSPDSKKIAYEVLNKDDANIYLINADGSGETRLTFGSKPNWEKEFSFSPMRTNGILYDTYGHVIKE